MCILSLLHAAERVHLKEKAMQRSSEEGMLHVT